VVELLAVKFTTRNFTTLNTKTFTTRDKGVRKSPQGQPQGSQAFIATLLLDPSMTAPYAIVRQILPIAGEGEGCLLK